MINIKSLSSGSHGNCYHVTDGSTPLLLECGISFSKIKKGIGYKTSELAGVLISHEHGDHIKSAVDLAGRGIDCYMSEGTFMEYGFESHRFNIITEFSVDSEKGAKTYKSFNIGSWVVQPFQTQHDAKDPLGYLLINKEGEKLLFATDTFYLKYKFPGLTHIMIECNYALDILKENIKSGRVHPARKKKILKSHFSLENVKQFLRANDLRQVQEIWLLHLSSSNSDEERFKREIQELTGKVVKVAD